MSDGYDANKSQVRQFIPLRSPLSRQCSPVFDLKVATPSLRQVSADSLAKFLEDEIDEEITSVPGIGPAAAKSLKAGDDGVATTYQLFGRFLTLKSKGANSQEHCDAMWPVCTRISCARCCN